MNVFKSFGRPEELMAFLRFKFTGFKALRSKCDDGSMSQSKKQCYDLLNKTCGSKAAVFLVLDKEYRDAFCICYLVLRALDTVEDDATIPHDIKVPLLKSLHKNLLNPDWNFTESNDKDKIVLENFPIISKVFRELPDTQRQIIDEVCQNMGEGMASFLERKIDTMQDLEEYGHYVSGLVVITTARLFAAGDQNCIIDNDAVNLANTCGIFIQKAHVIRDYYDDWEINRVFWPKEVWNKYVSDIGDFTKPENQVKAVECLNELVTNALELVPETLQSISIFKIPCSIRFIGFCQLIALATLVKCYNNPQVFSGAVKVTKGEAVRIMLYATSIEHLKAKMRQYILQIMKNIPDSDPSASKTRAVCQKALEVTKTREKYFVPTIYSLMFTGLLIVLFAVTYTYWT